MCYLLKSDFLLLHGKRSYHGVLMFQVCCLWTAFGIHDISRPPHYVLAKGISPATEGQIHSHYAFENNPFPNAWHCTGESQLLRSGLSSPPTSKGQGTFIWGQQCPHFGHEDRWFERGVKETIYVKPEKPNLDQPQTMQFWLPSPGSLTTIHTLGHMSHVTHGGGWVNDSQWNQQQGR